MRERLEKTISLMRETGILEEQARSVSELLRRYSDNELVVSVIGQFKRGKSSLINAMLGEELLPVGIIPLTTVVTEIRCGEQFKALICFTDGSEREVARAELPEYISEQKNRNNHKNVASVKLWVTSELFGDGITLVDTPGVGSVHQHNTDTSYSYIEKSDAVLFLLSVDSPVSEIEREFLLKTSEHASKFYFAVNKIDTISRENQKEFIAYCSSVLSETLGFDVSLYPVSSKTGEGVPEIINGISKDIHSSYDELLSASIAFKLANIISQAKSRMNLYLKAASIPSEELEAKVSEIRKKQSSLEYLSDEVQIITRKQTERLVERIEEHFNVLFQNVLNDLRSKASEYYESCKALPSKQFEQRILEALESVLRDKVREINETGLGMLEDGYAEIVASLNNKALETARYISDMVMEYFGIEYPIAAREFSVSERGDYYFRLSHGGSIYLDPDSFVHFLPKAKANAKIFDRALQKAATDLELNKNNILYNYRYKMQESLRTLCRQFAEDITKMSSELTELFGHLERERRFEKESLDEIRGRFADIVCQIDCLR